MAAALILLAMSGAVHGAPVPTELASLAAAVYRQADSELGRLDEDGQIRVAIERAREALRRTGIRIQPPVLFARKGGDLQAMLKAPPDDPDHGMTADAARADATRERDAADGPDATSSPPSERSELQAPATADGARAAGGPKTADGGQRPAMQDDDTKDANGEPLRAATTLRLNRHIVTAGDTVLAKVNVVEVQGYFISLSPAVWDLPIRKYFGDLPDGVYPVSGMFVHEIDTTDLPLPGNGGFFADPSRGYYDVSLHVLPEGGGDHITIQTERMFIQRNIEPLSPAQFSLKTSGRSLATGQAIAVQVSGTADHQTTLELVRLGRYLPGGAVAVDHPAAAPISLRRESSAEHLVSPGPQFYDRGVSGLVHLSDEPLPSEFAAGNNELPTPEVAMRPKRLRDDLASIKRGQRFSVTSPFRVGPYELRVTGRGGGLIGREPFEYEIPKLEDAIELTPASDEPYDFEALPTVEIVLPAQFHESLEQLLFVSVFRIGRGGVRQEPGAVGAIPVALLEEGGAPGAFRLPLANLTQAGSYEVRLWLGDGGETYLLDRQQFDLGGTPPAWAVPLKPIGPELEPEDVVVESQPKVAVWHDPFVVTVKHSSGGALELNEETLIASLYYLGHYTYGCARRQGYYAAAAAVVDGRAILPAPAEPGSYEIRVFRTLAFDGDPLRKLPLVVPGGMATLPQHQLVGVGNVEAVAPAAPGAIRLSAVELRPDDPLDIAVQLPKQGRNPHSYQLELWLAGDRLVGGILRPPLIRNEVGYLSARVGVAITSLDDGRTSFPQIAIEQATSRFKVDPLTLPGDYEARLFDLTTGLHVDRARFSVRDPGPPALPASARYRQSAITDWPTRNDALRGLEAWRMPKDACEDPVFEEPPELRLTELYSSDPESAEDDEFVPVTSVQPGHPIFVEAEFGLAPPDDVYRVKVNGERKIRVFRTSNPRLYRSKLVTLIPARGTP